MTLGIRTRTPVEIVPAGKVNKLGRAGGFDYCEIAGKEYVLQAAALLEPDDVVGREGQVFVSIPEMIHDDETGRSMQVGNKYRRALPVASGTYARTAEMEAARHAPAPPRPVDALALPALSSKAGMFVGRPSVARPPILGIDEVAPAGDALAGYAPGRSPVRGRAILDHLASKGVTLEIHAGRLLPSAPRGKLTNDLRAVIERAELLLVGWLTDNPVRCELDHPDGDTPEAWTILLGGLAACEGHTLGVGGGVREG